jgi:hypothetical protein
MEKVSISLQRILSYGVKNEVFGKKIGIGII